MNEPASPLPTPRRERWQPLRSGVLNLYRYDYEEFHYEDGRLLLRGNNGSGKSRVMALQLPFLLDAEVSPARVEPDGDQAKRIEWNLLMGRHPDRTGYTWIEFGRRDADGSDHFLTLGCGMRAVAGQSGLHSRWFFVTPQRIGRDVFLQTAQRQPLGRDRLQEAIGDAGRVYVKADEYRRAVDDALFGLGARYGALLELLLRLRRPQLSGKLNEEELTGSLSEALPTLSTAMVDEVAEAFRSLQTDREALRAFVEARDAVAGFRREYEIYMRIAVRRRAVGVRAAQSAYEAAQRAAREAEMRLTEATAALEHLSTAQAQLVETRAGAESAERTLRESPEMRTVDEIRLAEEVAKQAERAHSQVSQDVKQAEARVAEARLRLEHATRQAGALEAELALKLANAARAAHVADLTAVHREHVPESGEPGATREGWAATAERALGRVLEQRHRSIQALRERERAAHAAGERFATADLGRREAEATASSAREAEHSAREELQVEGERLLGRYSGWRESNRWLAAPLTEDGAEDFAVWLDQREGPSPLRHAIEKSHVVALAAFGHREANLGGREKETQRSVEGVDAAIVALERGDLAPPVPETRRAERRDRPGAPLWRVCDFRPECPFDGRAGMEAALQASGLLDAWLLPDGRLLDLTEDTFLLVPAGEASPPTRHLGEVLMVALDQGDPAARSLNPDHVTRVLQSVGLGRDSARDWIDDRGAWQLGPLAGQWTKPAAEFIGESNRAIARRRQLADLRVRRDELVRQLDEIRTALAALAADREAAAAELASAPNDEPVLRAGYQLEHAARRVTETWTASERATQEAAARRAEWDERQGDRDRDATDLKLTAWLGRLDDLVNHTHAYAAALASVWPTLQHAETVLAQLATMREQLAASEAEAVSRRERRELAAGEAGAARQRFHTLQETHGEQVSVILARLSAAEAAVKRLKDDLLTNEKQRLQQTAAQTKADNDRTHAEQERTACEEHRRGAISSLQHFAEQRLLAEADPSLADVEPAGWAASRAVEIARQILSQLPGAPDDDESWRRHQDSIHGHIQDLRDQLVTHGYQPEPHSLEDLVLVRCVFQGRPHTMTELQAAFTGELEAREQLLQAREREIIENHLLAEVAVELQRLIRAAESWRGSANEELSGRPTSSGVRFRFQWEPDAETRFHQIRPTLLRKGELWTAAERTAVAAFLQERIQAEQDADASASWRDHLAKALDYRKWHRFVVERQQDGQWRRLDKRTYGTGSGGEKALALTLPRFAAAAAHYRSARPEAPRLVMLDEAFAGIDPTMRAQCMGVLAQFDLDVVMTSELEWGCYATVPALAIYHLTTLPGLDAVAATRWVWNGRERMQRDADLPPAAPSADSESKSPVGDESAGFTLTP